MLSAHVRRFPIELAGAVVVTMVLYASLHALIARRGALPDVSPILKLQFTPLTVETETVKRHVDVKPARPDLAPPPRTVQVPTSGLDPGATAPPRGIEDLIHQNAPRVGTAPGGADRDAGPMLRVEPEYPMQARQRGIEGWVVVEFTVSAAGSVKDVAVVESEPGTVFDRNAVNAVRKWKYHPKLQDGRPVERSGVKVRLDFEMES
ncbi:MAG TPA: TonB family protein [Myxococcota bacterium]|nr:TonB family protein [Myxococcota bacterium]